MDQNLITKISIEKQNDGTTSKISARIFLLDGNVKKLVIGNVDNFLEKVEKYQINEKVFF